MENLEPQSLHVLKDGFGRAHTDLRVSVTDRCNIRCRYCMPAEGVQFRSHTELLTYEEIERFVRVAAGEGIRKVRLTGGEPLVRKGIVALVKMLVALPGIDEVAMTTNGILLPQYADDLKAAGLARLNISLDTFDRARFEKLTRCDEFPQVLEGIDAAIRAGFQGIKLNALAIRDLSEEDVVPLARFAQANGLQLRFIEFMPVEGDLLWDRDRVLRGEEILSILTREIGPLTPVDTENSTAPASEYRFAEGGATVGIIPSVSKPFCDNCDRLRLTSDGKLRNCLFSPRRWDILAAIRNGGTDRQVAQLIREAVAAKLETRGAVDGRLVQSDESMHQIGG